MSKQRIRIFESKRWMGMTLSIMISLSILIIFQLLDFNQLVMDSHSSVSSISKPLEKKIWAMELMMILFIVTSITLVGLNYYFYRKYASSSFSPHQDILEFKALPMEEIANSLSKLMEEQKKIEEELRMREEWLSTALTSIAHAVITTDAKGNITFINPTAEKLTGWEKQEAISANLNHIFSTLNSKTEEKIVYSLIDPASHHGHTSQSLLLTKQGLKLHIESSIALMKNKKKEWIGWVLVFQDVTDQKRTVESIRNQALTDELTGLPNRRLFQQEMRRMRDENQSLAVLFLDLDRFKSVNDSFGHEVGDLLLKGVAERLRGVIGKRELVVRWAGDEFVIVLSGNKRREAMEVAERILEAMREPFMVKGIKLVITPSIGISVYPEDTDNFDDLVTRADLAMYDAKKNGKNNYKIYEANKTSSLNS